jgi:hypothetical protein
VETLGLCFINCRKIQDKESNTNCSDKEHGEMVDEDTFKKDNVENSDGENSNEENKVGALNSYVVHSFT